MSNIVFTPKWNSSINQVEVYEPITGGANGNANLATRQLAENIFYLRDEVSALSVEINDTNKKFDTGIASAKDYADTKKSEAILDANTYADTKDVNNLKSAKDYTDSQNTINLNSAKSYSDTKKTEAIAAANSYSDTKKSESITASNSYSDTKKTEAIAAANAYADIKKSEAIAAAKDYADIADNTVEQYARDQDVINLNSANSYADTKKTEAIASSNSYSDTKKTEAIAAANTYTDQKQTISSYNPVFSSLTGVTSITGSNITYIKTDKMVNIFGSLVFNIEAAGDFSFKMSLPVVSNFANANQAGGMILLPSSIQGLVKSGTDKLLTITANAQTTGTTLTAGFNFTYIIV
jgi:hypothetical protein